MSANTLDLHQFQWNSRLLLIFAPTNTTEAYLTQQRMFSEQQAALAERDLMIATLFEQGESAIDGKALAAAAATNLRTRFTITPGTFVVLLVGKDGGIKEHFTAPVTPDTLFGIIDAMPMRQQEMREDTQKS